MTFYPLEFWPIRIWQPEDQPVGLFGWQGAPPCALSAQEDAHLAHAAGAHPNDLL